MPASLTRVCPVCITERSTPNDFRDLGEVGPGRPPKVCRSCRDTSPTLTAHQQENVAKRPAYREQHERYANRSFLGLITYRNRLHPEGTKTCPEVAGCGRTLPISAFATNVHQADTLAPICFSCQSDHAALRARK